MEKLGIYKNGFGEEIEVQLSSYNILTTDNSGYDLSNIRIINPFDLNISMDNPYKDKEKNNSCFVDIVLPFEKILVICKTKCFPTHDEMYEIYYDHISDKYNKDYNSSLVNKNNQLVILGGTSVIVLDINTLEVIKYVSSDNINDYGVNIFEIDNYYVVEDIENKFSVFDENLNEITDYDEKIIEKFNDLKKNLNEEYGYYF